MHEFTLYIPWELLNIQFRAGNQLVFLIINEKESVLSYDECYCTYNHGFHFTAYIRTTWLETLARLYTAQYCLHKLVKSTCRPLVSIADISTKEPQTSPNTRPHLTSCLKQFLSLAFVSVWFPAVQLERHNVWSISSGIGWNGWVLLNVPCFTNDSKPCHATFVSLILVNKTIA